MAKTLLRVCANFEKTPQKNSLFMQTLQLFLYFDDSELEKVVTSDTIQALLHVFDICRRADIVHSKVFAILKKIPLKINSDKEITNKLKNFCYFCRLEKNNVQGKKMTNVSTHFLYQLMEFFELDGDHEYDGSLKTWMEELKDLFGKKLLMESDLSEMDESQLRHSALEINADFKLFGDANRNSPESNTWPVVQENEVNFFEFDFTQPPKNLVKSGTESGAEGFGMSQGDFENPPPLKSAKKTSHLDDFDFDSFDKSKQDRDEIPESPIKSSSKQGKLEFEVTISQF